MEFDKIEHRRYGMVGVYLRRLDMAEDSQNLRPPEEVGRKVCWPVAAVCFALKVLGSAAC